MNSACQSCVSVDGQSISAVRIEIGMQGTRRLKLALNHLNAFSFVLIFVLLLSFYCNYSYHFYTFYVALGNSKTFPQ